MINHLFTNYDTIFILHLRFKTLIQICGKRPSFHSIIVWYNENISFEKTQNTSRSITYTIDLTRPSCPYQQRENKIK